jgi:hypothetical protein
MARKKSDIPTIAWTADRSALVWKLLGELAKKDNHAALYGVQKGNVSSYGFVLAYSYSLITAEHHWI